MILPVWIASNILVTMFYSYRNGYLQVCTEMWVKCCHQNRWCDLTWKKWQITQRKQVRRLQESLLLKIFTLNFNNNLILMNDVMNEWISLIFHWDLSTDYKSIRFKVKIYYTGKEPMNLFMADTIFIKMYRQIALPNSIS